MRLLLPGGDGPGLVWEVLEGGDVVSYLDGTQRPSGEGIAVALRRDWTLFDRRQSRVVFSVRANDGALQWAPDPEGMPQDMRCDLTRAGELLCQCDGHSPLVAVRYAIEGTTLMGFIGEYTHAFGSVSPAPTTVAERQEVLFVFAEYLMAVDADSHDGDLSAFEGP